ncbi:MAG: glycerol dehydrogenase [Ignavibacteria bacterium]
MNKKAVFPGQYIQGQGAITELLELINLFGSKGLILCSKSVKNNIFPKFASQEIMNVPFELFSGECCEDELNRIAHIIKSKSIDVIIGAGGGKVIDTAKIAADRADIPVIVVPTIASTDAPCSGCAVTYTPSGVFEAVHYQKKNPSAVIVDLNIIANAPVRFLVAGMGDALATWFEARSCANSQSKNECGGLTTLAGLHIAKLCYETILEYGVSAKTANENHEITLALEYITEANILLSGIGFESSGLASAHAVHNGLTALEETHRYYHGEKVAFGVLTGLHLNAASSEEINTVYSFCESIGLPTTLSELGITKIDRNYIMKAAENACIEGSSIFHESCIVTVDKVLDAMLIADSFGNLRKIN